MFRFIIYHPESAKAAPAKDMPMPVRGEAGTLSA